MKSVLLVFSSIFISYHNVSYDMNFLKNTSVFYKVKSKDHNGAI